MALILNIETATTVCSVALAKDGRTVQLKETNSGYTHSENLTVFIQQICSGEKIKLSDLDAIAVSKGPGSYTGLRIGVSTAKGLCVALDKPLIAVNTLKGMAKGLEDRSRETEDREKLELPTLYCPMLDARRMEVYCAVYDSQGKEVKATSAQIIDENSFSDLLISHSVVFFGDGSQKCKSFLGHHSNAVFLDNVFPSAKNMAVLSEEQFLQKKFEDLAYFEPFYLKDFVGVKKK